MKNTASNIVHQIPFFKSFEETCNSIHRAEENVVKINTEAVTAHPGSQLPKIGPNQLYFNRSVPAMFTISEGVVGSDVETDISEPRVNIDLEGDSVGLYRKMTTDALTMVYASNVPIDMNSTSFSKSKSRAIVAENNPETTKFVRGTCVFEFTSPRNPKRSPSVAMAYMQRGRENSDPNKVVVIPHRAPIDTAYFTQCIPTPANASGSAALGLIS